MTFERKFALICLGLTILMLVILGLAESPAVAFSTGVGLVAASLVGVAIGWVFNAVRQKVTGNREPEKHSNAWFVRTGFIVGSVLAAGSVLLECRQRRRKRRRAGGYCCRHPTVRLDAHCILGNRIDLQDANVLTSNSRWRRSDAGPSSMSAVIDRGRACAAELLGRSQNSGDILGS